LKTLERVGPPFFNRLTLYLFLIDCAHFLPYILIHKEILSSLQIIPGIPGKDYMVLILIGPMGCGKTTIGKMLAEKLGWPFYDGDDFHPKENVEKMRAGSALTDGDRRVWLEKLRGFVNHWLKEKQNTILACSALKQAYRDLLGVNQMTVRTVYLRGSYPLLRKRIEKRQHPYMDKNLLRSQLDILEEPKDGLSVDISETPETIVRTILENLRFNQRQ
jgi:carbohydrate kinase (thermoresistant glucokinase family)